MRRQKAQSRTCAECFHYQACSMWSSGDISDTAASLCQMFEPMRYATLKELQDLYKMHKGDVEPVVHAEWKYYHKQNKAVCTACSFERDLDADFGRAIACPNCGAKMDSKK